VSKSSQIDLIPTQDVFYAFKFIVCTFRCRKFASTRIFKIFRSLRGEVLFLLLLSFTCFFWYHSRSFAIKRVCYFLLSFSTKFKKRIHYRSERKKGVTAIFVFFRFLFCSVYFKINFNKTHNQLDFWINSFLLDWKQLLVKSSDGIICRSHSDFWSCVWFGWTFFKNWFKARKSVPVLVSKRE